MLISEAIQALAGILVTHGDLPIVGGFLEDDTPPVRFTVLDKDGAEIRTDSKPDGVFIE